MFDILTCIIQKEFIILWKPAINPM